MEKSCDVRVIGLCRIGVFSVPERVLESVVNGVDSSVGMVMWVLLCGVACGSVGLWMRVFLSILLNGLHRVSVVRV